MRVIQFFTKLYYHHESVSILLEIVYELSVVKEHT